MRNFERSYLRMMVAVRIVAADGAEGGRRGEERRHVVLGDDAPEGAGVGRADRLALVEHARAAVQQRRVDDVGMADHPADVGGGPERLAGIDAVDRLHRPFQRDHVAAIVAHDAFRLAGRAGGVEDVERVGRLDRHAFDRAPARLRHRLGEDRGRGRRPSSSAPHRAAGSGTRPACAWRARSPRRAAACRGRCGRARCRRRRR